MGSSLVMAKSLSEDSDYRLLVVQIWIAAKHSGFPVDNGHRLLFNGVTDRIGIEMY